MEAVEKITENEVVVTKKMKERQKELLSEYADMLREYVWKASPDMVDFCVKEVAWICELKNGLRVVIEKERLETHFCFGYSDSAYDTVDYDRANDMARYAGTSRDYFLQENMKHVDGLIRKLESCKREQWERPYLRVSYSGQEKDSKFRSLGIYRSNYYKEEAGKFVKSPEWDGSFEDYVLRDEDIDEIIKAYQIVAQKHRKRVLAYLKRYGMEHVRSWSYWRDA